VVSSTFVAQPEERNGAARDTSPEAERRYTALLRAQPPHRRLEQAMALTRTVRELAVVGIKQRHPAASSHEIRVRLAVRLYGIAAAERIFGAVPEDAV
jgi:hypothetical protein